MQCPLCHIPLQMSVRQEVEIDYCPQCRGVWLDRGELDKIIERSLAQDGGRGRQQALHSPGHSPRESDVRPQSHHDVGHYRQHKRKSFLSDLFDFD